MARYRNSGKTNAARAAREYLAQNPTVEHMAALGLANSSAIARLVMREYGLGLGSLGAVKAAVSRYKSSKEGYPSLEKTAMEVLGSSSVSLRSNVVVVASRKTLDVPVIVVSSGRSYITSIIDRRYLPRAKKGAMSVNEGLALISISSPRKIKETPGVVWLALEALARSGINIQEMSSSGNDTMLVTSESDSLRAMEVIFRLLKGRL
ncbi:MAG: hypothetical protein WC506_01815 [Candidatus Micrarchaeia archaeon]